MSAAQSRLCGDQLSLVFQDRGGEEGRAGPEHHTRTRPVTRARRWRVGWVQPVSSTVLSFLSYTEYSGDESCRLSQLRLQGSFESAQHGSGSHFNTLLPWSSNTNFERKKMIYLLLGVTLRSIVWKYCHIKLAACLYCIFHGWTLTRLSSKMSLSLTWLDYHRVYQDCLSSFSEPRISYSAVPGWWTGERVCSLIIIDISNTFPQKLFF